MSTLDWRSLINHRGIVQCVGPMTGKKEWVEVYVWDKVRCRVRVETEKGKVKDMLVQLEVNDVGWKPAIRYNFAHGRPHMDIIPKKGKKRKIWLEGRELEDILTFAEIDLRSNWRRYLKECGYIENDQKGDRSDR